jgi:Cu/Ag efflux protein CusF
MRRRRFVQRCALPLAAAALFGALVAPRLVTAGASAYWSPIHATVLSVDRRHKTITIRNEALETVPSAVRVCAVRDARSIQRLRGGEQIEARAETSHAQWMLDGIRIIGRSGSTGNAAPGMAAVLSVVYSEAV